MNQDRALAAIAAIRDPVRRALYELVAASAEPIGRDRAAAALGVPRSTAAFHLDQLVASGLLEAGNRRLSGRSGPGAGRPAKVYSRAAAEIAVSLPARRYDLMAELFASALDELAVEGDAVDATVRRVAGEAGGEARRAAGSLDAMLAESGYEPRRDDDGIALDNCPFHRLAGRHGALVCAANLAFLRGAAAADDHPVSVVPAPSAADGCCARFTD